MCIRDSNDDVIAVSFGGVGGTVAHGWKNPPDGTRKPGDGPDPCLLYTSSWSLSRGTAGYMPR